MSPRISVIIAVYNAQEYLEECLNTVINQTLKDIEIICVNDGSEDNSLDILEKFAQKDPRIVILNQENQGAGSARNNGLKSARGEYLSFLDADDFFELNMLEEAYIAGKRYEADVCVFGADLFDQNEKDYKSCEWSFKKHLFPVEDPFNPKEEKYCDNIFRMYNGWAWDKLFRREFVEENNLQFQRLRTTNDMFFVFIALAKARKIVAIDKILAHQRVELLNSLSRTREKSWQCFYIALLAMQEELKKSGLYELYKKAFVNWSLNFSLWQLSTLRGETQKKTYELLAREGFAKLDIAKYPREFFYSEDEYEDFLRIFTNPYRG